MRRTTDINRITTQPCFARFVAVAVAFVVSWSAAPCFAQGGDSGIPKGFRPPPPTPKEYAIEKPLIKEAEVTAWKRKRTEFQDALAAGKLNGNAPKIIDEGFRVNVLALSLTEQRDELTDDRKGVVRYVDTYVAAKNVEMKKFACKTIVKYATQLLDGNFHVRLQAVLLIGELDISPEVPGLRPTPAVAYIDGLPALLDVIHAPEGGIDQPEPVRILAAMGSRRLLERGRHTLKINSKLPDEAARRMLAELSGNGTDWYHQRLIEGVIETAVDTVPNAQNQQEPLIVEALARILANPGRSLRIRARAAYLAGRTPMPGGVQAAPLAYSIVKLTKQVADELNQKRIQSEHAIFYLNDIYLAFKNRPGESTTDGRKLAGLMSTLNQPPTKAAYDDILPVVQSIFRQFQQAGNKAEVQATINAALVEKLNAWPKPDDMKLSAGRVDIDIPLKKPAAATPPTAPPTAKRAGATANPAS